MTTDADRLLEIEILIDAWEQGGFTDAEALAKVRALLSEGEPAESDVSWDGQAHLRSELKAARRRIRELEGELAKVRDESPELPSGWVKDRVEDEKYPCTMYMHEDHTVECYDDGDINVASESTPFLKTATLHAVLSHHLAGYAPQGAPPEDRKVPRR
jgi:hypothetical protein